MALSARDSHGPQGVGVPRRMRRERPARRCHAVAAGQSLLDPAVTERVLDQVRRGPAVGRDEKLARLTPREEQILSLVASGKTNGQIAKEIFLSEKTVKTHVSNILMKLGVHDRTQAALLAVREGLVDAGDGGT